VKVFISWSGEQSREIGKALEDWLPSVLQYVEVYFSPSGIEKGASWFQSISSELKETVICIAVVDNENYQSAWISFEAGAISKGIEKSRVCPLLIGMKAGDLSGPLSAFQGTVFEQSDVKKLVGSINHQGGDRRLSEKTLNLVFDKWWPDLKTKVDQILVDSAIPKPAPKQRTPEEMFEEVSVALRQISVQSDRNQPSLNRRLEMPLIDLCEVLISHVRSLADANDGLTYHTQIENVLRPLSYMADGTGSKRVYFMVEELKKAISGLDLQF
jgi:TIR domain